LIWKHSQQNKGYQIPPSQNYVRIPQNPLSFISKCSKNCGS
jgi:hypothetical protein